MCEELIESPQTRGEYRPPVVRSRTGQELVINGPEDVARLERLVKANPHDWTTVPDHIWEQFSPEPMNGRTTASEGTRRMAQDHGGEHRT
ncbi:hypothetical protein ACFLY9_00925 [Patescibacteria group bacterium]